MLPWKCHSGNIMKRCGDCNNCTKFQFYREKIFGDTPSFVMLHNFGRFPFDQKFRDFRSETEWNGKNSGKSFRKFRNTF